ncbi:hypothetical protein [uncultured Arthrobacter sp.]|uniref:hypothetical protein n=1 Tax=uncultured Arthrobacter sp. TaxID=114050 RepID=UPI0026285722|nr:hypothetical protein [uncultured Arthrobacter sp.]
MTSSEQHETRPELQWQRIRFWRSALLLGIPVAILSLASGLLFFALEKSTAETFDDIHFWFYFFDVGREINVPTWFSSGLWIVAGVMAGFFSRRAVAHRRSWVLFAVVCVIFSIDEMLELHERLDTIGHELAAFLPFDLGFVWVIPGAIIALAIVLALTRLVFSLPVGVRNGLLLAGAVFAGGGMGVETLAGLSVAAHGMTPEFFVLTLIEETCEMAGIVLCVAALAHLVEYKRYDGGVAYRLAPRS